MSKLIVIALLLSCGPHPKPTPNPTPPAPLVDASVPSQGTLVTLMMEQIAAPTVASPATTSVYFSFGADSVIKASDWSSFCTVTSPLTCNFTMKGSQVLPTQGKYLNVTLAFGGPVGCGATKAEVNVNNPTWFDTLDVSLVDGYSNKIEIDYTPPGGTVATKLGPPLGKDGNEKVLGLFPYGCDICTARQNPPCKIAPGGIGCKSGTQFKPDVPCQYQGAVKGGGGTANVILLSTH
jgi:hypothetical protein